MCNLETRSSPEARPEGTLTLDSNYESCESCCLSHTFCAIATEIEQTDAKGFPDNNGLNERLKLEVLIYSSQFYVHQRNVPERVWILRNHVDSNF